MTGKNTAKFRVGVMRSCIDEKHSKVPHMRRAPVKKQVTANTGRLRVLMVMILPTMSPMATTGRMVREGKRNFRRNRMGNIIVMPMNEAYPAMRISSCMSAVAPTISLTEAR